MFLLKMKKIFELIRVLLYYGSHGFGSWIVWLLHSTVGRTSGNINFWEIVPVLGFVHWVRLSGFHKNRQLQSEISLLQQIRLRYSSLVQCVVGSASF